MLLISIKLISIYTSIVVVIKWLKPHSLPDQLCAKTMRNPKHYFVRMILSQFLHLFLNIIKPFSYIVPGFRKMCELLLTLIVSEILKTIVSGFLYNKLFLSQIRNFIKIIKTLNMKSFLRLSKSIFNVDFILV